MELKVWVEGIQRIVCGVTETTTCQDVVFALAHATGKSGRFTLIERWRNNERQLAPNENPLKLLMKWGEYSNDVQFILQWNESNKNTSSNTSTNKNKSQSSGTQSLKNLNITVDLPLKNDSPKSPHHISNQSSDNIGVVKGVPHVRSNELEVRDQPNYNSPTKQKQQKLDTILTSSNNSSCSSNSNCNESSPSHRVAPPYKDPPAPPPYRDPPPPNSNSNSNTNMKKSFSPKDKNDNRNNKLQDSMLFNAQYRELIALINYQREKLSNQQADLTKFDAEIVFWESKEREKQMQLDYITQELNAVSNINKINQDQIQALIYIEEESEIVKQQEKTLKSEITLLRSKLANCETELLQCKNKIRLLLDELQIEQRAQSRRTESKKHIERNLLVEMERIHHDIELAKQSTELHHLTAENLKKEVAALEQAIIEKKKQVELLVTEMKEANLQSLTIAPPEDLRAIFEGPNKSGSTRKMIGSPRQLENAVPTNKNPHGVWV